MKKILKNIIALLLFSWALISLLCLFGESTGEYNTIQMALFRLFAAISLGLSALSMYWAEKKGYLPEIKEGDEV